MQDGRYAFRGKKHLLLPLLFLLPQLAITVVFFFYPAGEALMGSFYMEDSFGLSKEFVGLDNFTTLCSASPPSSSRWGQPSCSRSSPIR